MSSTLRFMGAVVAVVMASAVLLSADDFSVQVDPRANFATFQTFSLRSNKIATKRPELDNSLFAKQLSRTIREAFIARGLKESEASPDLRVDFSITGEEVSTTQRGIGAGPVSVRYTVGTLVIEAVRPGQQDPVWRAYYKDDEGTGSKLVTKLQDDARKLIEKFPRK